MDTVNASIDILIVLILIISVICIIRVFRDADEVKTENDPDHEYIRRFTNKSIKNK